MLHKFVDFYMVIINQILHTYAHIKILFENYPKLVSYFHSYISISYVVHSYRQLLLFRKVWAVYTHAFGLSLPIFHHRFGGNSFALDPKGGLQTFSKPFRFFIYVTYTRMGITIPPAKKA